MRFEFPLDDYICHCPRGKRFLHPPLAKPLPLFFYGGGGTERGREKEKGGERISLLERRRKMKGRMRLGYESVEQERKVSIKKMNPDASFA